MAMTRARLPEPQEKQREIAKNMKEKNIPNADIAEITGLSVEEVEELQV